MGGCGGGGAVGRGGGWGGPLNFSQTQLQTNGEIQRNTRSRYSRNDLDQGSPTHMREGKEAPRIPKATKKTFGTNGKVLFGDVDRLDI